MPRRTLKSNEDAARQIRAEAKALGAKVRASSQVLGEEKAVLAIVNQEAGVCRSYVIYWLKGRKTPSSTIYDRDNKISKPILASIVTHYKSSNTRFDAAGKATGKLDRNRMEERAYIKAELRFRGLTFCAEEEHKPETSPMACADFLVANGEHGPVGPLRSINVRDGYNHAMGLDLTDPKAQVFFDPNWGEFTFATEAKLVQFLKQSLFVADGKACFYANVKQFYTAEKLCFS